MRRADIFRGLFIFSLLGIVFSPLFTWGDKCLEGLCQDGMGIGFTDNGGLYDGQWKEGLPNGEGVLSFKGAKYQGQWTRGKLNGIGLYTLPDGTRYEGEFRDDLFHGRGELFTPDGKVNNGIWREGEFVDSKEETLNKVVPN